MPNGVCWGAASCPDGNRRTEVLVDATATDAPTNEVQLRPPEDAIEEIAYNVMAFIRNMSYLCVTFHEIDPTCVLNISNVIQIYVMILKYIRFNINMKLD